MSEGDGVREGDATTLWDDATVPLTLGGSEAEREIEGTGVRVAVADSEAPTERD